MTSENGNKPGDEERTQFMPLPDKDSAPGPDPDDERTQFTPLPDAPAPSPDDEKTQFTPLPDAQASSPDDEKTQFTPLTVPPAPDQPEDGPSSDPAPDETGTTYSPVSESPAPEGDPHEERTQITAGPMPSGTPDEEATQFVTNAPVSPDEERTQLSAPPSTAGAVPPDEERTAFAPPPGTTAAPDDQTAFAPTPSQPPLPPDVESTGAEALSPIPQPSTSEISGVAAGVVSTAVGVGTLINRNYEITQVLKSGGMGEVYRGVNIHTTAPVAIKAILPELAGDEKAGLLFKREAQTLSELGDEAIVRYHNFLHDTDLNRFFLVMEFIEGVPLSDHIEKSGAIPAPAILTLLKRLAKGLSKAHAQDVIHRDLSPDNVMLPGGDVAEARLIDFGIAKSNVVKEATMHGQFAGKFKYVAPEQLGHYDGIIGPATDIYGLALLVCAAALGKPLDMGSSIVEAVQSRQAIPDLSDIDDSLRPILSHMLEPDPMKRPASMEEVRRMLENPGMIPQEYRQGIFIPPVADTTGRTTAGLSTPPMTSPPLGLQVPGAATTTGPSPLATDPTTVSPLAQPEPERKSGGASFLVIATCLGLLGAGGWYAWDSGLIGTSATEDPPDTVQTTLPGIPEPQISTRSGFLAAFDTGPCTYVARVEAGANAGLIEGYSQSGGTFGGLPTVYEEQFGARPEILPRQVSFEQCAALEFARGLQGRGRAPLIMQMSSNAITSGDAISAQVRATRDEALWTVLIDPAGSVFSLMSLLSDSVGGLRSLQFSLAPNAGGEAQPYLVLMVNSDFPLTRAAAAQDGAAASVLLPLILEEIAEKGGGASAALGYVMLAPAGG